MLGDRLDGALRLGFGAVHLYACVTQGNLAGSHLQQELPKL